MRKLLIALSVLVLTSALTAAELTGKWTGTLSEAGQEGHSALLVLKQTGNELSGTAGPNEEKQFPIQNGKVDGDKVTFDVDAGGPKMHFELTASEKRLTGNVRGEHEGETLNAKLDLTKAD